MRCRQWAERAREVKGAALGSRVRGRVHLGVARADGRREVAAAEPPGYIDGCGGLRCAHVCKRALWADRRVLLVYTFTGEDSHIHPL